MRRLGSISRRIVLGLVAALLWAGPECPDKSAAPGPASNNSGGATRPASGSDSTVPIVFTKDILGEVELCGCSTAQAGGLSRKSATAKALPGALLFDAGNFLPSPDDGAFDMNARLLVASMVKMGYRAVNLGKKEAALDINTLLKYVQDSHLPVVASNIVGENNRVLFDAYTQIQIPPNQTVAVIGLVGRTKPGKGLVILDPVKRLQDVLKVVPQGMSKIVLADLDAKEAQEVLTQVQGVDLVIGVEGPGFSSFGVGYIAPADREYFDEWAGIIKLRVKAGSADVASSDYTRLDGNAGEDNDLKDFIEKKRAELMPSLPHKPSLRQDARGYIGADTCKACHVSQYGVWSKSLHRHAFKIMELQKVTDRPDCVVCHTTGFDRKDYTYFAQNVTCESCHGPGANHVAAMKARHWEEGKKAIVRGGPETCKTCHLRVHDPLFDFSIYWPKIAH